MKCDIGRNCNNKVIALIRDNEDGINQTFLACENSINHKVSDEIIMIDNPESYFEAFILSEGLLGHFKGWLFNNLKKEGSKIIRPKNPQLDKKGNLRR